MTKKIFHSILLVAGTVLLASLLVIMGCLYEYFGSVEKKQLRDELELAAVAVKENGTEYLSQLSSERYRLTWIAPDGTVLYEDESVRLILVGAPEINEYDNLTLRVIVENMTDHNLMVSLENLSCNGWSISDDSISVPAKKKAKEIFEFYDAVTDAEIEKAEDVQDIEGSLYYFDTDTYDTLLEPVHFSWVF
mgnify:CR=1 FL=1